MRLGGAEIYGTVEDALKECEMVVYWSSDPESIPGPIADSKVRSAASGCRNWALKPSISILTTIPLQRLWAANGWRPGRIRAMRWLWPSLMSGSTENLYDKEYVATRTTGFDKWKDYILGKEDGIPKTPEWQEKETGVPAKDVRALAREWGTKKTYLGAGSPGNTEGGACRCATGLEWARSMVCLMAMQGIGKPGINMGNMTVWCTPRYPVLLPRIC